MKQPDFNSRFERLYGRLIGLAHHIMRGAVCRTIQPTELIGEAFVRIKSQGCPVYIEDDAGLLSYVARTMRNVLVDHARRRLLQASQGSASDGVGDSSTFVVQIPSLRESAFDAEEFLDLEEALRGLECFDPGLVRVVNLRMFCFAKWSDVAFAIGCSSATAHFRYNVAINWLRKRLR